MQKVNLSNLSKAKMLEVPKEELVDVSSLTFDNTIPRERRAAALIGKIKNPYCFRVGEVGVKLEFPEEAPTFQEAFDSCLLRLKSGL